MAPARIRITAIKDTKLRDHNTTHRRHSSERILNERKPEAPFRVIGVRRGIALQEAREGEAEQPCKQQRRLRAVARLPAFGRHRARDEHGGYGPRDDEPDWEHVSLEQRPGASRLVLRRLVGQPRVDAPGHDARARVPQDVIRQRDGRGGPGQAAQLEIEAGLQAAQDAGHGVLGLRDADDGGQEGGGQDPEVQGGESDAVRLDVDVEVGGDRQGGDYLGDGDGDGADKEALRDDDGEEVGGAVGGERVGGEVHEAEEVVQLGGGVFGRQE